MIKDRDIVPRRDRMCPSTRNPHGVYMIDLSQLPLSKRFEIFWKNRQEILNAARTRPDFFTVLRAFSKQYSPEILADAQNPEFFIDEYSPNTPEGRQRGCMPASPRGSGIYRTHPLIHTTRRIVAKRHRRPAARISAICAPFG